MTQGSGDTVLLITQEGMGSGAPDLQLRLLSVYLKLLLDNGLRPGAICFYTAGVRLIAYKTCLDYFNIGDKIQVRVIGGMGDIQAAMALAAKVITL